jgi:protein required for attachment to host cells
MMLLPHGTVVAVVDGSRLNLFRNGGSEVAPELMPMVPPKLDEHSKDGGARHHSSSANPTGHQLGEDAHAAAVGRWLNDEVLARRIQQLVVVAAPRTLGELRRYYSKSVQAALVSELHKDLAGRSGRDILEALQRQ